ncbi:orotidine-5'-phosphate decarboxylase [Candidatus Daviesbacteria bacterium]|nr:orotidine-5'-phosphate decarboxylase [Candidatus Daviesbacteria bacterium]
MANSTIKKLEKRWSKNLFICVGLDSDYKRLPNRTGDIASDIFEFNKAIIDSTFDLVCAYKPNAAFYEAYGTDGLTALKKTSTYLKENYPDIAVILDAKRGDIGSTNEGYVSSIFDNLKMDGVTVSPYLGQEALEPFLERKDKLIIVLAKTSNPGSAEFQDLVVGEGGKPLYQVVAERVARNWNKNGNCGVVVGATYPSELVQVRKLIGDLPILIPGLGTQGGEIENTVRSGMASGGWGMIINSSRGIIFASDGKDFAQKARDVAMDLNKRLLLLKDS